MRKKERTGAISPEMATMSPEQQIAAMEATIADLVEFMRQRLSPERWAELQAGEQEMKAALLRGDIETAQRLQGDLMAPLGEVFKSEEEMKAAFMPLLAKHFGETAPGSAPLVPASPTMLALSMISDGQIPTDEAIEQVAKSQPHPVWNPKEKTLFARRIAATKDSGIEALVVFDSERSMRQFEPILEPGIDPCYVGFRGEDEQISGIHEASRAVRLRSEKGAVFVEVVGVEAKPTRGRKRTKTPKKLLRIPARLFSPDQRVELIGRDGLVSETVDLATFVQRREASRARDQAVFVPDRADNLTSALISEALGDKHLEALRSIVKVTPQREATDLANPKKAVSISRWLASVDLTRAKEIATGLTDESRALLHSVRDDEISDNRGRRRKTIVEVDQMILPYETTSIEISAEQMPTRATLEEMTTTKFLESIERALWRSPSQTLWAVFNRAYRGGGLVVQSIGQVLADRRMEDGGPQRKKIRDELDLLSRLTFTIKVYARTDSGEYKYLPFPIMRRYQGGFGQTIDGIDVRVEDPSVVYWAIDPLFYSWMQSHRAIMPISPALLATTDVWVYRTGMTIAGATKKGFLGDEMLVKADGARVWTVRALLHRCGLELHAHSILSNGSRSDLRDRIRETLEGLKRCGPDREEQIAHYEIRRKGGDPMDDEVEIWPSTGHLEIIGQDLLGKASQKALAADQKPAETRGRGRSRKA